MTSKGYDKVRGRYAPSPTGELHLGNALTALISWLQVRKSGGSYILRIEDIDRERSRPEFGQKIIDDLKWLGLDWDEGPDVGGDFGPYCQSGRNEFYRAALEKLAAQGAVFDCYCTRAEVARSASAPHGASDEGLRYPSTCLNLSPQKKKALKEAGRRPTVRFRVPPGRVAFDDLIFGRFDQDVSSVVGDFVLLRADGSPSYQLAAVADDIAMRITHVVRGGDLIASTPRQILLYGVLGAAVLPEFAHVPLLLGPDGVRLSKRHGDISLAGLRRRGVSPEKVVGFLAGLAGLVPVGEPVRPTDLIPDFDLSRVPRTGVIIMDAAHLDKWLAVTE